MNANNFSSTNLRSEFKCKGSTGRLTMTLTWYIRYWHQIAPYVSDTADFDLKKAIFLMLQQQEQAKHAICFFLSLFHSSLPSLCLFIARSEGASLLDQSTQFPAIPCFTVSSWDIRGDIKARGLLSQIPQAGWPGSWLISCKIHALVSQKTLDQGWRGWLIRGSIYLLCQMNLSAGGLTG